MPNIKKGCLLEPVITELQQKFPNHEGLPELYITLSEIEENPTREKGLEALDKIASVLKIHEDVPIDEDSLPAYLLQMMLRFTHDEITPIDLKEFLQAPMIWAFKYDDHNILAKVFHENGNLYMDQNDEENIPPVVWAMLTDKASHMPFLGTIADKWEEIKIANNVDDDFSQANAMGLATILFKSPIIFGLHTESLNLANYFANKESHVNKPDHDGRTPLSWAKEYGYEEIKGTLVSHGAVLELQEDSVFDSEMEWYEPQSDDDSLATLSKPSTIPINIELSSDTKNNLKNLMDKLNPDESHEFLLRDQTSPKTDFFKDSTVTVGGPSKRNEPSTSSGDYGLVNKVTGYTRLP